MEADFLDYDGWRNVRGMKVMRHLLTLLLILCMAACEKPVLEEEGESKETTGTKTKGNVTLNIRQLGAFSFQTIADGQTDMTYEAAQTAFPTMEIRNGMYSNLQLRNIPYAANGWKVYCRYSNTDAGYVDTAMARLTVIPVLARQTPQPGNELPAARRSDFEGAWADTTDGRCQILFTYRDETSLNVGILWRDLSGRRDCWNMTATVYSEGVLVYGDGHYWAEVYSNDNSYTVSAESWNGTGSFYFENGRLHWYNGQTGEEVVLKPV